MSKLQTAIQGAGAGFASGGGVPGALVGGVLGGLLGGDDQDPNAYMKEVLRQAEGIPLPILKEYYPEMYKVVAQFNPELETAVNLGPSEMQGIATDPAQRQAQINALSRLQEIGAQGGLTAQDRARQAQIQMDINSNLKGNQDAIMQNLAARGMGGGMTEMVNRQLGAQAAANRQAQLGMETKAQAEARALDALMRAGGMAGQMQAQDFSQAAQKAQAADIVNRFNAQNQQGVLQRNVGNKNAGNMYNTQMQQGVANQNTGLSNQAQQYNIGLPQQQFQNQLGKLGLASGVASDMGKIGYAQDRDRRSWESDIIGGAKKGAEAWFAQNKDDDKKPEDYGSNAQPRNPYGI